MQATMKIIIKALLTVLLFYLVTRFFLGAISAWNYFIAEIKKVEPHIFVPLIFTLATALLGLFAALYTQSRIRIRQIEEAHRDKKIQIYFKFMELVQHMLQSKKAPNNSKPFDEEEALIKMVEFNLESNLWGSPKVLLTYKAFKVNSNVGNIGKMFKDMDNMYRAMREDIGLSNKGLKELHFVKSFLTDPSELDDMIAKQSKD